MKKELVTILGILIIIVFVIIFFADNHEDFRGGRGMGRGGGGALRYRGGGAWRRRGINSNLYLRNFRRRPPMRYGYGYGYNNVVIWPRWFFPVTPAPCKKGCTPNGCPLPGNKNDECVWASDCYGCLYSNN